MCHGTPEKSIAFFFLRKLDSVNSELMKHGAKVGNEILKFLIIQLY